MAFPALRETFKKELLSINSIAKIFIISFIYFSFSVLIINYRLVLETLFSNSPVFYKFNLLLQLILGSYSALGVRDFILVILTSVIVGANILILFKTFKKLKDSNGKLSLTVGGTIVLGIFVAGSCSCGFSVLSLLGLTGALSFLPFKGLGIHLLIIALLIFSFWYSLRTYHRKVICKIK